MGGRTIVRVVLATLPVDARRSNLLVFPPRLIVCRDRDIRKNGLSTDHVVCVLVGRAQHRVRLLQEEIRDYYSNFRIDNNLIELRNLVVVAELIINSALARKESRGLHYTLDYPQELPATEVSDTIMVPPDTRGYSPLMPVAESSS